MMIRLILTKYTIGLNGQVLANLLMLLISLVLALRVGEVQDGYFSLIIGSSTVIFVTIYVVTKIVGSKS